MNELKDQKSMYNTFCRIEAPELVIVVSIVPFGRIRCTVDEVLLYNSSVYPKSIIRTGCNQTMTLPCPSRLDKEYNTDWSMSELYYRLFHN